MVEQPIRVEQDLLGEVQLLSEACYGIQTKRAVENFPRNRQLTIGHYPNLIKGLLQVKQAAAIANQRCDFLSSAHMMAIVEAAQLTLAGDLKEAFPVHRLHGGGGTSANMNVNEVLARLGNQLLDGKGEGLPLHPSEHVNLHQSTNDVYPTACHIAILLEWQKLNAVLKQLVEVFQSKADTFAFTDRLARTCLQDAVAISGKDFFSGYTALVERCRTRLDREIERLHCVNLGGTIVGNTAAVPPAYLQTVLPALREVTGNVAYFRNDNLFDAAQNPDDLITVAECLAVLARGLIKIGKDIRLLSSGPEAGLNELNIPAVQPGSSAMPGKVNPVIPEFLIQSCMEAVGKCHTVAMALDHGELDLNIWESLIVFNILDAMDLLENAVSVFTTKCVLDLRMNEAVNRDNCKSIIAILEQLSRTYGYEQINNLCKQALASATDIRTLLRENNLLSAENAPLLQSNNGKLP